MCRAPSSKLVGKQRLVSPVTTRHSTGKRYPRSPRRDATGRNKAELSPWTLSGAASAQADRPRMARRKAVRNAGAKALRTGQLDKSTSCHAAGATVALAPLSVRTRLVLQTNKTKRRAPRSTPPRAYYPDRRVVTPAGSALRRAQQVHDFD